MSVFAEVRLPLTAHPLGSLLTDHPGVTVDVEPAVPVGGAIHHAWVRGEGYEAFVERCVEDGEIEGCAVAAIDRLPDRQLLRLEFTAAMPPVFRAMTETGGTLVGTTGTAAGWTLHVRFPDERDLVAFLEECARADIEVGLQRRYRPEEEQSLTATQATTLRRAFEDGYFDVPRGITLAELASELGVSEQAASERLRRGLASLLASTPLDEPPEGTRGTEEGATD